MSYSFKSVCSNIIPAGKYKAIVSDIKFASGGSKSILVTVTISEGDYAKRVHTETIPEKAYSFRLMPFLQACKVDVEREFATSEELYKFGFANAKGKTIMIDMGIRTYNGQEYNNITAFSPLPDSTVSADDVAKEFGTDPEVKGSFLDEIPTEGVGGSTPMNAENPTAAPEPELDVNLDDIENPF